MIPHPLIHKKYIIPGLISLFSIVALIPILIILPLFHQPLQAMFPELSSDSAPYPRTDEPTEPPFFFLAENGLHDARFILDHAKQLRLTDQQQKKLQELMLDHESFRLHNSADIKIKELRFTANLRGGVKERAEVEKYIREISEEKTKLIIHFTNYLLDVRDQLTPEQQKLINSLYLKLKEKFARKPKTPHSAETQKK